MIAPLRPVRIARRAPTRVDFAGGTLDLWPLYLAVAPECHTLNASISLSTEVILETAPPSAAERPEVSIELGQPGSLSDANTHFKETAAGASSHDAGSKFFQFENVADFLSASATELALIQSVVRYFTAQLSRSVGFNLKVFSQSPIGGGLGGSSSLCVNLIRVFEEWLTPQSRRSTIDCVRLACDLEGRVLGKPAGTQDFFPPLLGGVLKLSYRPGGVEFHQLGVSTDWLNQHTMLVYTGRPHHSGINNWQVFQAVMNQDQSVIRALADIAAISLAMEKALLACDLKTVAELTEQETRSRMQLTEQFMSPEIVKLRELSIKAGAKALKICGAGGGGCVLLWVDPAAKSGLTELCQKSGFPVLPMLFAPPLLA